MSRARPRPRRIDARSKCGTLGMEADRRVRDVDLLFMDVMAFRFVLDVDAMLVWIEISHHLHGGHDPPATNR